MENFFRLRGRNCRSWSRPARIWENHGKAAADTGIPKNLPVIAAGSDKACEILGAGCMTPETACLSFGTIATTDTAIQKYVELKPFIPPLPGRPAGPTLHGNRHHARILDGEGWFKEQFTKENWKTERRDPGNAV
ncbi:MAG: hypothetical protein R2860_05680 [Desulfobacterales bacterium]